MMEGAMRKGMVVCIAVAILLVGALSAEAYTWGSDYPYSPDRSLVYDRYSWDWWNHAAITWNNTAGTASLIQMDPDGVPNQYMWADFYTYTYDVYMSYDGYYWWYYGTFYY